MDTSPEQIPRDEYIATMLSQRGNPHLMQRFYAQPSLNTNATIVSMSMMREATPADY